MVASSFTVNLGQADLQIQTSTGEVVITNDGATILKHMAVLHPAARMVSSSFLLFGHTGRGKLTCSWSNFPRLRISKLEMEQPVLSSSLVLFSERLRNCLLRVCIF
jgi:hypothetical protein